ncbi:unnamed protein product [Nesidiocoris tenuis]|uniref:Uncharacterized protein n=1 Tax=Nesidiocoris tenuis TaxID=355587 RepID=A0A6H5FWS1_9HEMI|nr:unnamed protein product [Nesidiocoris tenuis]
MLLREKQHRPTRWEVKINSEGQAIKVFGYSMFVLIRSIVEGQLRCPTASMLNYSLSILKDANSPESLKNLIKKVSELQSSRKFGNLIQNNVPKPDIVTRGPQKPQTLKSTSSKDKNAHDSKAAPSKESKFDVNKENIQPAIANRQASNIQSMQLYSAARPRLLENLVQYLRSFWWSVMPKIVRPRCKGRPIWCQGWAATRSQDLGGVRLPRDLPTAASLFTFRVGLCKSSNVDTMRPVKNWVCLQPQRLLHGTTPMYPQPRLFSTTASLRAKDSNKDCKRKGGSLPCLTPVGIVKKDKGKGE